MLSEDESGDLISSIRRLQADIGEYSKEKGWRNNGKRSMLELIALMHSELSEAVESYRLGERDEIDENGKPVGIISEFADCIIRILDACDEYNLPLAYILVEKHKYNQTRAYRHGGKLA